MSSAAQPGFDGLFEGVVSKREHSEAVASTSRRTLHMVEAFHDNLLSQGPLTDEQRAHLASEADRLEDALRVALRSEIGVAETIPRTLACVSLDQPEHVGLLDCEAAAVAAFATSLRSTAAAIRLMHELRRRAGLG